MRSHNSHFNSHAKKEFKASVGDWLRRGSGGNARHVSPWIVEVVTESLMARVMPNDTGNPYVEPSLQGASRPPLEDLDGYIIGENDEIGC